MRPPSSFHLVRHPEEHEHAQLARRARARERKAIVGYIRSLSDGPERGHLSAVADLIEGGAHE